VAFAIDAATGKVLWSHDAGVRARLASDPSMSWLARANRGVAVWGGKVYQTTADCRLLALDAKTGRELWSQQTCDPAQDYGISDSPYVGGDKVFVGNAGSESPRPNRGYITAYDADSGKQLWRTFVVPSAKDEENDTPALKMAAKTWSRKTLEAHGGGGQSWNEMTYDPSTGLLFFGTSGAYPYVWKQRSPEGGDNLFLSSVMALNAETGEYAWHYQTVPEDSWDYNATMNIALADLEIGGKRRETLLIAPKNGFHYTLDRRTGELLVAGPFAKMNWATHVDMKTGRPVLDPAARYWEAKPGATTLVWPNMWGAHGWNAMAYSPRERLSYIPVTDIPAVVKYESDEEFSDDNTPVTEVDGKPFAPGKLVAFDPVAGEIRWRVEHPLPYNGGVLATAGGLVFQGNAQGDFVAYAADSGAKRWSVHVGSATGSAPASFTLKGRQYIIVPVGGGGGLQFYYPQMHASTQAHGPVRLLAFSLDERSPLTLVDLGARELPEQPPLEASAETLAEGKALYAGYCKSCHGLDGVARVGGTVPDLRYATLETHRTWSGIVIGGAKRANGMPAFELQPAQAEAIRAWVLSRANELRRGEADATH
jgi:quinohemoprotein ethanol dehydrogenase